MVVVLAWAKKAPPHTYYDPPFHYNRPPPLARGMIVFRPAATAPTPTYYDPPSTMTHPCKGDHSFEPGGIAGNSKYNCFLRH